MIRKVIIGALALFVTAGAVHAQTNFGIKGGFNAARTSNANGDVTTEMLPSFHAGLVADIGITEMFSVRTGLDLQGKGRKYTYLNNNEYSENPLYVELPVNFTVNFPLGATKIYVGAGPYISAGVAGKVKETLTNTSREITWGNDDPVNNPSGDRFSGMYKRFDAGANIIGGVTFNDRFGINLQYGMGLVNSIPGESTSSDYSRKHRVFGVGGVVYF